LAGCGGFKCCGYVLTAEAKERERKKIHESPIKIEILPILRQQERKAGDSTFERYTDVYL
jgi:hypothetical protein